MNGSIQLIDIEFHLNEPSIRIESDWFIILLFLATLILFLIIKKIYFNTHKNKSQFKPVELTLDIGNASMTYSIERNYENLEIAHRIYIELITRKAAMPIDDMNDVIKEIYDSWYSLFQITRDEIKKITGESLQNLEKTNTLIKMSTDILNKGLRPHLTQYQAKFRKWYSEELEKQANNGKSPQEIQRCYPEYDELIESMVKVNDTLIEYSEQLNKFIVSENETNTKSL